MSTPAPTPGHEDLAALHAQVRRYESELAERDAVIAERDALIEHLQEQVRLLLAQRFAPSSEKMPDGQLGLFNEAEASAEEDEESESAPDTEVAAYRRGRPKRAPLPAYLPRVDIVHRLAQSQRTCPHHAVELERFGEVVSEQLDIIPAKVRVLRHIRAKYRCPRCEGYLRTASMPAQAVAEELREPRLLSFIATAKYADALPLYRQHRQLQRIGVECSRTTLARWMVGVGELVVPLINVLRDELLDRTYLLMDETTVQVLKEPGKAPESKSQLWAQMSAGPEPPIVLFEYDPTRAGGGPQAAACRILRRIAYRRLQRLRAGGARAGTGAPRMLGARPARLRRGAEEPRTQSEEAAGESAREGAPRTVCAAAHPNALRHRAPYPATSPHTNAAQCAKPRASRYSTSYAPGSTTPTPRSCPRASSARRWAISTISGRR